MRHLYVSLWVGFLSLLLAAGAGRAQVGQSDLDAYGQEQLSRLDPALASECVEVAARLPGWKKDVERLKADLQATNGQGKQPTEVVLALALELAQRSDAFRELIGVKDDTVRRLREAEVKIKKLRSTPRPRPMRTSRSPFVRPWSRRGTKPSPRPWRTLPGRCSKSRS